MRQIILLLILLQAICVRAVDTPPAANPRAHTASPNVQVLPEELTMPGLDRQRTIRIYLPPGYTASKQRFPVLYMHDGQNLFDEATSFLGEWDVDETLDDLAKTIGKDKTWVSGMLRILSLPVGLQEKVGSTQLSVSYDAMIRIARLENGSHQAELVERLIGGASQREIRDRIDQMKGKSKAPEIPGTTPKPKRVYRTSHHATVIVQGTHSRLGNDDAIGALTEALDIARGTKTDAA